MAVSLTGKACQCRACGLVFTTASNFDKHRVGDYVIDVPGYGRRCLSDADLRIKGWAPNRFGRWARPGRPFNRAQSPELADFG